MLRAGILAIANNWKKPKCPSTGKWINTLWYIHTGKRKNELLMNIDEPQTITPSERSQTQKITCCIITFIYTSRKCKLIHSDGKQISGFLGWRWLYGCRGELQRSTSQLLGIMDIILIVMSIIIICDK